MREMRTNSYIIIFLLLINLVNFVIYLKNSKHVYNRFKVKNSFKKFKIKNNIYKINYIKTTF